MDSGCTLKFEQLHLLRQARRRSLAESQRIALNTVAIAAMDGLALAGSLAIASLSRFYIFGDSAMPIWSWLLIPAWWVGSFCSGLLPGWGLSAVEHLRKQILLITGLFALATITLFFSQTAESFSRLSVLIAWLCAITLVPFGRTQIRGVLIHLGIYGLPTVLFGKAEALEKVIQHMKLEGGLGYNPVGVCVDEEQETIGQLPVLGDLSHSPSDVHAAIVCVAGLEAEKASRLIHHSLKNHANVLVLPDLDDVPSLWVAPRDISGLLGLQIRQQSLNPIAQMSKRSADLFLIVASAPFWLSVCGVLALLTWLEDGHSPLYWQERVGRGGRRFKAWKFRTMVPNAEQKLKALLATDSALREEWEQNFKLKKDPRITKIGVFLRKTSLDELPQLINVLKGEMALVGPRPLPEYHLEQLPGNVQEIRARMRPGMTGLWQVSGRSDTGNLGMSKWDPYYVRNWSIWLDAVILVRTVRVVLFGSGAY